MDDNVHLHAADYPEIQINKDLYRQFVLDSTPKMPLSPYRSDSDIIKGLQRYAKLFKTVEIKAYNEETLVAIVATPTNLDRFLSIMGSPQQVDPVEQLDLLCQQVIEVEDNASDQFIAGVNAAIKVMRKQIHLEDAINAE